MNNITYANDVPKDIYKPSFYYDGEEVRPIPDAEGYYVSESGKVYSTRELSISFNNNRWNPEKSIIT